MTLIVLPTRYIFVQIIFCDTKIRPFVVTYNPEKDNIDDVITSLDKDSRRNRERLLMRIYYNRL